MRVTLNQRSTKELELIMQYYGFKNPTYTVQKLITELTKSLNLSPIVEDIENAEQSSKSQ